MLLAGSCYCEKIKFNLESRTPYPYMHCYCSICRKTAGGSGYAINIMGEAKTLKIKGKQHLKMFHAMIDDEKRPLKKVKSPGRRYFCRECGSALWVFDPRWPEWVYPFASAIDTRLPKPPARNHVMLNYKVPWVSVARGKRDSRFGEWPKETIIDWHRKRNLLAR